MAHYSSSFRLVRKKIKQKFHTQIHNALGIGCVVLIFIFSNSVLSAQDKNKEGITLRVASAANFYPTLKKIAQAYEKTSNNKISIIRGSTGKLYAQIMRGAPYDIFFSADSARIKKLIDLNRTHDVANNISSFVYAKGKIVLWKPAAITDMQLKKILFEGAFNKLAIANPKTAPYGRASVEALKKLNLYSAVKNKLVYGENIAQVMQFVQTGAADIGIVAKSYTKNNVSWDINGENYTPIRQSVTILKQSNKVTVAKEFLRYLNRLEIKQIIINDGYGI